MMAGVDTLSLAKEYGTPLYVLDEDKLRRNCREYFQAMKAAFGDKGTVAYAGKALSIKALYPIINEERLYADVVSRGEIYTALAGGFPGEKMIFHGVNKTPDEIAFALDKGVGIFVVDNEEELCLLNSAAGAKGIQQKILVRITLGIDPHTFEEVKTGKIDSQFGAGVETGMAKELLAKALEKQNLQVMGFHSHIGSQIAEVKPFLDQVDKIVSFVKDMKDELGFTPEILNLGGGFAIRYTEEDPAVDVEANIKALGERLLDQLSSQGIQLPQVILEPGRSIVGDAGLTLYTVGRVKVIPGYRTHVIVDGGMTDNPRFALYGAKYTVVNAGKAAEAPDTICTIPGRCCESGDRIGEDIKVFDPRVGDVLAVLSTGAYNYSMASNYNRVPRPAMVMLKNGSPRLVVKRETLDDLIANDL